jgi:hypothetical protein
MLVSDDFLLMVHSQFLEGPSTDSNFKVNSRLVPTLSCSGNVLSSARAPCLPW